MAQLKRPTSDLVHALETSLTPLIDRILELDQRAHSGHSVGRWQAVIEQAFSYGRAQGWSDARKGVARDMQIALDASTAKLDDDNLRSDDLAVRAKAWHDARRDLFEWMGTYSNRMQSACETDQRICDTQQIGLKSMVDDATASAQQAAGSRMPVKQRLGYALRAAVTEFERVSR